MKKRLLNRLDAHFGACTAMAAGAAIAGIGEKAEAVVVYSGAINLPLPNTFAGIYINLVTGSTSTGGFANQDVNFYNAAGGVWMANLANNAAVGATTATPAQNVPINTVISAASQFVNNVYPGMSQFAANGDHIFGLRFLNEGTATTNYGWIRIRRTSPTVATLVEYAYDNATGGSIQAGNNCGAPLPHPLCLADIVVNAVVDTDDLLALLGTWGQIGPFRPLGDIAPANPGTGNCTVDTDDLLAMLGQWGTCVNLVGGCCLPNGSCTPSITSAACTTLGGAYQGDGSACPVCPVIPPNDNPAGAFLLAMGTPTALNCTNTGTNANATLTAAPGAPTCSTSGTRDVWWKYQVPTTPGLQGQVITIDTCSTLAPFTDTILAAYGGTDPNVPGPQIGCIDDGGCTGGLLGRLALPQQPPGTWVFVRLYSWGTAAANQGNYVLCTAAESITQDACLGAETLAIGATDVDLLSNANQDLAPTCGRPFATPSVSPGVGKWYKVTGDGTTLTASTCTGVTTLQDIYDGRITVYCGVDCAQLLCAAATNANAGATQPPSCPFFAGETVSWCAENGRTYWVLVHAATIPGGTTCNYTLQLTSNATACTTTTVCGPPPPPANDACGSAIAITALVTNFNNATATPVASTTGIMPCVATSKDIWYTYTAATTGAKTLTIAGTAPYTDSTLTVYTSLACPPVAGTAGVNNFCNDDAVGFFSQVTFNAVAGTQYRIQIGSFGGSLGGNGSLTIAPAL